MARYNGPAGGFYSARGERKKGRFWRNSLTFVAVFLTYHVGFGCRVYPVDPETNTLLAPDWYAGVGLALAATVTVVWAHRKEIAERVRAAHRCSVPATPAASGADVEQPPFDVDKEAEEHERDWEKCKAETIKIIEDATADENAWRKEQSNLPPEEYELACVDQMDGLAFENWCADLLRSLGYTSVEVTQASNDYGADILAELHGIKYAIQCKRYGSKLGNTPIQEVCAARKHYNCDIAAVMTNQEFTPAAVVLAEENHVKLWGREKLKEMLGGC